MSLFDLTWIFHFFQHFYGNSNRLGLLQRATWTLFHWRHTWTVFSLGFHIYVNILLGFWPRRNAITLNVIQFSCYFRFQGELFSVNKKRRSHVQREHNTSHRCIFMTILFYFLRYSFQVLHLKCNNPLRILHRNQFLTIVLYCFVRRNSHLNRNWILQLRFNALNWTLLTEHTLFAVNCKRCRIEYRTTSYLEFRRDCVWPCIPKYQYTNDYF